ncbi:MAG: DUF1501 domain-containing protein [Rubrivivax sp.]|jgi:uncharacterized protein (DUF1501 family)
MNGLAPTPSRRSFVRAALSAAALTPWASLAVAQPLAGARGANRFVFVILRGGLDGLAAVPAIGDASFAEARGSLASFAIGAPLALADSAAPGLFALNPLLPQLHAMYGAGELAVLHATGLPYRERSHFDAQQVLESGGTRPYELSTGWLGRAMQTPVQLRAVALQTAVPLVLRGPMEVDTWAPSNLPDPGAELLSRLELLYRGDSALAGALARAKGLRQDMAGAMDNPQMSGGVAPGRAAAVGLARKAAEFLGSGAQIAVLEMGGWDSHANQGAANGAFSNNLRTLDGALAALREGLLGNGLWRQTVVLVATEFGREVAGNGTGGTDHGSGGAAFVLGGAVRGGRVLADWPGLARKDRFEGRDLRITTDLRAAIKPILVDHLGVPGSAVDTRVLPGSAGLKALDLLRA